MLRLNLCLTPTTGSHIVQTKKELIWPKGKTMAKYKAGLHKEVSMIFDGVWIPEIDNLQQSFAAPVPASATYVHPELLAPDQWSFPQAVWAKRPRFGAIVNVFRRAPVKNVFTSKANREKKRLLEISKHLLINLTS